LTTRAGLPGRGSRRQLPCPAPASAVSTYAMAMYRSTEGPYEPDVTGADCAAVPSARDSRGARTARSVISEADELSPGTPSARIFSSASRPMKSPLAGLTPSRARLPARWCLVDVVPLERVLHLEPQGVARAEPDRAAPSSRPRARSAGPEPLGPVGGGVPARSRPRRCSPYARSRRHSATLAPLEPVVADPRHVAVGQRATSASAFRPPPCTASAPCPRRRCASCVLHVRGSAP